MNNWIIHKLMAYLTGKEGFQIAEEAEDVKNGKKAVIQDVFGYRYELQVKVLGRINNDDSEFDTDQFEGVGEQIAALTYNLRSKGNN